MVFGWFQENPESKLPAGIPTRLPSYFPVQPRGCETVSQALFDCVTNDATDKARDMEKAGFHKSYFEDVKITTPEDETFAALAKDDPQLPNPGDNPLDECRLHIGRYMQCCDRQLKKKKNWILTEPYRVQEEYRYSNSIQTEEKPATAK